RPQALQAGDRGRSFGWNVQPASIYPKVGDYFPCFDVNGFSPGSTGFSGSLSPRRPRSGPRALAQVLGRARGRLSLLRREGGARGEALDVSGQARPESGTKDPRPEDLLSGA